MTRTAEPERDRFRDWPRAARWAVYALVGLVVIVLVAVLGGIQIARRSFPQTSGSLHLPGLAHEVTVLRDARGVPQVYAQDSADLFYGQGYVQAQDRFWQMDLGRHRAEGRLAEMLGPQAVGSDLFMRAMGWERIAQQEYDLLSPAGRAALDSFSRGVNAWLRTHSGSYASLEYAVQGFGDSDYQPSPWTSLDSLTWLKSYAWSQSGGYTDEVDRSRLSLDHDPAGVARLYPPDPHGDGGTAWVVSGDHTTSGAPVLAVAPHLGVGMPGKLYAVGLHCRTPTPACPYDVSGLSAPAAPGVLMGHNQALAWSATAAPTDTADLVLESLKGERYLDGHRWRPLAERQEQIAVAGEGPRQLTVRSSAAGPLLSDVSPQLATVGANAPVPVGSPPRGRGYAVALSWTGLRPTAGFDAVLGMDRAIDPASFERAARGLHAPVDDLLYADRLGHIGYLRAGDVPVRRPGQTGEYPAAGWRPSESWTGRVVPAARLPHRSDPESGVLVVADAAPGGPSYTDGSGAAGYQAARIDALLQDRIGQGAPLRVADMARIQADTRNPMAAVLVPYLLDVRLPGAYYSAGQRLLAHWDFTQRPDSAAAAYFAVVWSNLLRLTFDDQLPQTQWPDGSTRWMYVVSALLRQPENPWWDDTATSRVVETRDSILARAMKDARDELTRVESVRTSGWTWGALHRLDLHDPVLSAGSLPADIFDRSAPAPGGDGSVFDSTWDARAGYGVTAAPAARLVIDLGAPDRSTWVLPPGISGHAFDGHYRDQLDAWLTGSQYPWPSSPRAVQAAASDSLRLIPARTG